MPVVLEKLKKITVLFFFWGWVVPAKKHPVSILMRVAT